MKSSAIAYLMFFTLNEVQSWDDQWRVYPGCCYRPQRSWGKVMFLQASVILSRGVACMARGWHVWRGGRAWPGGHAWWRGGCAWWRGACVVKGGHALQRGGCVRGRGVCVAEGVHGEGGHAWQRGACMMKGACVAKGACMAKGDMHGGGGVSVRGEGGGSYWNTFFATTSSPSSLSERPLFLCTKWVNIKGSLKIFTV